MFIALVFSCVACAAPRPRLGAPLRAEPRAATRLASGSFGICAVRAPGEVVCWADREAPERMTRVGDFDDAIEVAVGDAHACVLRETGAVLCFGKNDDGQLGRGPRSEERAPLAPVEGLHDVVDLVAAADAACAVERSGRVACWGDNQTSLVAGGASFLEHPTHVPDLADARAITLGGGNACVLHRSGDVSCWGGDETYARPRPIADVHDAVEVAASGMLGCARLATGAVHCWRHPHPTEGFMVMPTALHVPEVDDAARLTVFWDTVCVERAGGELVCAGSDVGGRVFHEELGAFDGADAITPRSTPVILCGVDRRGEVVTTPKAVGFCGENELLIDGAGRDLAKMRRAGFSAETSLMIRLGLGARTPKGQPSELAAPLALHVPLVFGHEDVLRAGPFVELLTTDFASLEPSAGAELLVPIGDATLWAHAGGGYAIRDGVGEPTLGATVGYGIRRSFERCAADCGVTYAYGGGLELGVRRGLGDRSDTAIFLAVTVDPAFLALPFAMAF